MPKGFLAILFLVLSSCGSALNGRAGKGLSASNLVDNSGGGVAASVLAFSPPSGDYVTLPNSISVSFSGPDIDNQAAASTANYRLTCGGYPMAPDKISFAPGSSTVTIFLPPVTSLSFGSSCVLQVSGTIRDSKGNFLIGEHSVTYRISPSGSSAGASWIPAASAYLTGSVGDTAGESFTSAGGPGMVLSGLSLGGGQYVDGVAPLRSNGFSSSAIQSGEMHGSTSAGSRQLFCPSGYRMTGVFGKSGSYIDSIGIICKTEDQSQTYTSQVFGGAGGSVDFNLSCPPGRFVTDLNGNAGTYLNRLYLGCR